MPDGRTDADELCFMPTVEQARAVRTGQLSSVELVDAVLDRVDRVNPNVNAFVTLLDEHARKAARKAEGQEVSAGNQLNKLHGIPFTLKDVTLIERIRTTFGSKAFADNVPDVSGPMYQRLLSEGGILIGKTATPEMAFKGVTDSPLTGFTNNP